MRLERALAIPFAVVVVVVVVVVVAAGASCNADLAVPPSAQLTCASSSDCPSGLVCAEKAGLCLATNSPCLVPSTSELVNDGAACGTDQICVAGLCVTKGCGDGFVDASAGEECDDGANNSDAATDACRTSCTLPKCGDLVVDERTETCDDAGADCAHCVRQCALDTADCNGDLGDGCECAAFPSAFPASTAEVIAADAATLYGIGPKDTQGNEIDVVTLTEDSVRAMGSINATATLAVVDAVAAHDGVVVVVLGGIPNRLAVVHQGDQLIAPTILNNEPLDVAAGDDGYYFITRGKSLDVAPFSDPTQTQAIASTEDVANALAVCGHVAAWTTNNTVAVFDHMTQTDVTTFFVAHPSGIACAQDRFVVVAGDGSVHSFDASAPTDVVVAAPGSIASVNVAGAVAKIVASDEHIIVAVPDENGAQLVFSVASTGATAMIAQLDNVDIESMLFFQQRLIASGFFGSALLPP